MWRSFRQIATASGPCGNNKDYVFLLEKAMYEIGEYFSSLVLVLAVTTLSACREVLFLSVYICLFDEFRISLCAGHEDDMVIELANEVRKVIEDMERVIAKDKLVRPGQLGYPHDPMPALQLHSLPEPIALDL